MEKCVLSQKTVEYLGHRVNADGLHPLQYKVEAILLQAPEPKNVQQLKLLLGLLNYYSKFIRNLASIFHPLNKILQQNIEWKWSRRHFSRLRKYCHHQRYKYTMISSFP